jgi:hypothetical protein
MWIFMVLGSFLTSIVFLTYLGLMPTAILWHLSGWIACFIFVGGIAPRFIKGKDGKIAKDSLK